MCKGHAALRYRNPDAANEEEADVMVNVEGLRSPFVQFYKPKDYFYSTDRALCGDQCGVYNRGMISVRLYNVEEEKLRRLHRYFVELQSDKRVKFFIVPSYIRDFARRLFPDRLVQYGNCARFTSLGLVESGISLFLKGFRT